MKGCNPSLSADEGTSRDNRKVDVSLSMELAGIMSVFWAPRASTEHVVVQDTNPPSDPLSLVSFSPEDGTSIIEEEKQ
jgi:hypothetical protein